MTDPYAETDEWPTAPATRPHSDAQPVSAPEPSGGTPEAGEGGRAARYAEAATELGADGILAVARLETQVDRLNAAIERARMERALAEDAETAATDRAEAAEAEVIRVNDRFAKARNVNTELRAEVERWRKDWQGALDDARRYKSALDALVADLRGLAVEWNRLMGWPRNVGAPGLAFVLDKHAGARLEHFSCASSADDKAGE